MHGLGANMDAEGILVGALIGILVALLILTCIVEPIAFVRIDHTTANEICTKLTNNTSSVAEEDGAGDGWKLVCKNPSYDTTQNIIIKNNAESKYG